MSWLATACNVAGAYFVAHGRNQRLGFQLYLIANFGLAPILVAHHIWSQVLLQIIFGGFNIYALWQRRIGEALDAA
jgi:nicotinamide riboside transporter PnuC